MRAYASHVLHELWVHSDGQTFCLSGPHGDDARFDLPDDARLTWTVEATSHFEAMTLYYAHMESAYRHVTPRAIREHQL